MQYAVQSRGVGKPVAWWIIGDRDPKPVAADFVTTEDPRDHVLAEDGTLRRMSADDAHAIAVTAKLGTLRAARDAAIEGGITFAGHRYYTDRAARADLMQAVLGFQLLAGLSAAAIAALPAPPPDTVRWKTADPSGAEYVTLTPADLVQLFAAVSIHVETQFTREATLIGRALSARTPAALDAVRW